MRGLKIFQLITWLLGLSQAYAQTQPLGLYVDISRLQSSRTGPYVEIYTAIAGQTLHFEEAGQGGFQARVNLSFLLSRIEGTDTVKVKSKSYTLDTPSGESLSDTSLRSRQAATLLKVLTFPLPAGRYRLEVMAIDSNATTLRPTLAIHEFRLDALRPNEFAFSDIKWVAGIMPREGNSTRWGRDDLIPLVTNSTFYNQETLEFYQEIYHASAVFQEKFYIRSVIYQGDRRLMNYETEPEIRAIRSGPYNAFKQSIPIGNLSSNTYQLQVELLNEKGRPVKVYRKKFFVYNSRREAEFEQSVDIRNPDTDMFNPYSEAQLDYYIRTLVYRATDQERNFITALKNYQQKKNFLYSFFERRLEQNPRQTVQSMWNGHLTALNYVNQRFGAVGVDGWQTDRGRVWITYGPPNDIERFPSEPGKVPYEIWRYNRLESQANVAFIFYDPDRATGAYPLLHSTRYGELNNPRWREQLRAINAGRIPANLDYERRPGSPVDPKLDINQKNNR
jgi:GWxTD domain-containing protein